MLFCISQFVAKKNFFFSLQNRIVIGHAVFNDFCVIRKHPPGHMVRDTAKCKLLVEMAGLEGQGNSLKKLAFSLLGTKHSIIFNVYLYFFSFYVCHVSAFQFFAENGILLRMGI